MDWAWAAPVRPAGRKFVLVALASHVNEEARAWPSKALLWRETSQSRRTVYQHLRDLEVDGWLTMEARRDGEGRIDDSAFVVHYERGRAYLEAVQQGRNPVEAGTTNNGVDHEQISPMVHEQISPMVHEQISPPPCANSSTTMGKFRSPYIEEISKEEIRGNRARAREPSPSEGGVAHACEPNAQAAGKRPWETLSHARLVAAVAARRAERGTTVRLAGITEAERQAADAYIAAVDRGEIEDAHGLAAPHAIDVWRRHERRLQEIELVATEEGKKAWGPWLSLLTPHTDDGKVLTLAAPSRLIAETVERDYADRLGEIVERTVVVEVHTYAGPAAQERQRRSSAG